jgi:hypothetical protein
VSESEIIWDLRERSIEGRRYIFAQEKSSRSMMFPISEISHISHFAEFCDHCMIYIGDSKNGFLVSKSTVPTDLLP